MRKNKKIILFISTIMFCQIFTLNKSNAKALLINYDLTEGVNVTDKPSGEKAMKIVGGIDYPDIYEIKGEKNNCFEINFKGKTAYTEKAWYHILDDIKAINDLSLIHISEPTRPY